MTTSRQQWIVMGILTTLMIGCSGGGGAAPYVGAPPVKASGKVTYKNAPVEEAVVSFLGDGNSRAAIARTNSAGEFVLTTVKGGDGAVPGTHKVTVTKIVESPSASASTGNSMEDAVKSAKAGPPPKPLSLIPEKYGNAKSSPLSYEVKPGDKNYFTIDLTD